jgi:hypothetical protein
MMTVNNHPTRGAAMKSQAAALLVVAQHSVVIVKT